MSPADPLIVPVEVTAMVRNDASVLMHRQQMNYAQLDHMANPAPGPFDYDPDALKDLGVYLMWTLPAGLRRQRHTADGAPGDFPFVPNRWLVVRLFRPAAQRCSAQAPQVTSWVVRGDGRQPLAGEGAAYLDPARPAAVNPIRIGVKTPVTEAAPWQEPADSAPYFLRAVAPGNPAFAAYQPFNQNVFSIFDDLRDHGEGTISYYVLGWYSDAKADVLHAADEPDNATAHTPAQAFAAALTKLSWSADDKAGQVTTVSVFHGSVFGVPWAPGGRPPASPADGVRPSVAIGSTTVDAVAAFARAAFGQQEPRDRGLSAEQAAGLIEAFGHDLLPLLGKPGAGEMLKEAIRAHWFSATEAGSRWEIVDAPGAGDLPPAPPTPAELAAEDAWLTSLNTAQSECDGLRRELLGVQRELYAMWCKKPMADDFSVGDPDGNYPWGTSQERFQPAIDRLTRRAGELTGQIAARQRSLPAAAAGQSLAAAIEEFAKQNGLPSARLLKQVPGPAFWAPVDPVAVVSHTRHQMRLDPGAVTQCRWPAALVTAVSITPGGGGAPFTVTVAQVDAMLPAIPWANLPAVGRALLAELFLLDPGNVGQLAVAAAHVLTADQVSAAAPPVVPAGHGTLANPRAPFAWQQPWRPLFFDWRLEWFPAPFLADDGSANWAFDGLDYHLVQGRAQHITSYKRSGRTLLLPQPSFQFRSRVLKFIKDYPDSAATAALNEIDKVVQAVDEWDFISQSLSGMGIQLAGWNPSPALTPGTTGPDAALAGLIGDQASYPPAPQQALKDDLTIPESKFEGMRAGQFAIWRLSIVDAFGQVLEIVLEPEDDESIPRTPDKAVFTPLAADGLQPDEQFDPPRFVQLPPRVLQPARLNLDLRGDTTGNPVIGWLLPNHLDSAIAAYGPDGTAYGELRLGAEGDTPDWDAAPGSPWPRLPAPQDATGDLMNLLATLRGKGRDALSDFLRAVDESLWTVDHLGARADTFLSMLIGRPLAVVRLEVSLELLAAPWRDMDWPYTFADPPPDPRLLGYKFPVRLGDVGYRHDGLIGYFTEGAYGSFNCVHLPDGPLTDYLRVIGPAPGGGSAGPNYVTVGFGPAGPSTPPGPGTPVSLTLIMDPRASVHARCGLVPVVDVALPPRWVDGPLSNLAVTFRAGPALLSQRAVQPSVAGAPGTAFALPTFAAERGVLTWLERNGADRWAEMAIAAANPDAALPPVPPTLREGVLRLAGGVDE